ncbi:MAG: hypothetical protein JXQ76_09235 [Campylobacterales bacterium]|nr:hypothetical protein [Campylobacterales bacterium]
MKKTLLLSMAATAVLFAGGDIVEPTPIVEAKPCPTSNLKWYGQTVLYYQTEETINAVANQELFDGDQSAANFGLKLGVTGSNLMGTGLGFGAEVVALGTFGLQNDGDAVATAAEIAADGGTNTVTGQLRVADGLINNIVDDVMQLPSAGNVTGGALTQLYLSYTLDNTTVKVGRMELPKALSPFAFSETWNVFANTFDAALLVNSDLPDTTLVLAYVVNANAIGNLGNWNEIGVNGGLRPGNDGAFMVTAQNKSIEGLTLTGSFYYLPESSPLAGGANLVAAWHPLAAPGATGTAEDVMAVWGDAKFMMPVAGHNIGFGIQGGMIDAGNDDPTIAYGVKAMGKFNLPAFGNVALCAAYTGVDMGGMINAFVRNVATGVKTPLYTQMILNQNYISGAMSNYGEANTFMVKGSATYDLPALGNVGLSVAYSSTEIVDGGVLAAVNANDYAELDVVATTKLGSADVMAAYVNRTQDNSNAAPLASNEMDTDVVRVWAKWNF